MGDNSKFKRACPGAPESFYSGQLGFFVNGGVAFDKSSSLDGSISLNLYSNMDQLKLKAFSRLPKLDQT